MVPAEKFKQLALSVLEIESKAVQLLSQRIDESFVQACQCLLDCAGRIVVMGIGKSGHIGGKIAATLASTGSPAFFVHPGEASHGDLGMITRQDVVLALSYSGETAEILTILPLIKRANVPLVTLTGNPNSTMAKAATVNLDISVEQEACPLGLAPTASSTATLAMGDALAVSLLDARGFTPEDFAMSHPGGALGRRLLLHVDDIMRKGQDIPKVTASTSLREALIVMSEKTLGMTTVVDEHGKLQGVFTDGDLRRILDKGVDVHSANMQDVEIAACKTITVGTLAVEALSLMEAHKITSLVVLDKQDDIAGVVHMHHLLQAGVV